VLALVAEGRSNRAIAERLAISIKTVERAIAAAFVKPGLDPDHNVRSPTVVRDARSGRPASGTTNCSRR